jgi:hypothetical protein
VPAAHHLEEVGIALLRHDRRTGGECRVELDEAELGGREEHQLGGEPPQVLEQERDFEQQLRLGLAARQLHRGHRLVHFAQPELGTGELAVDRQERHAVARRRAERILRRPALDREQSLGVVAQLGGEACGPQRDARRHGLLLMV